MYLNNTIRHGLNEYGKIGYDAIPKAISKDDIYNFIDNVITNTNSQDNNDILKVLIPKKKPSISILRNIELSLTAIKN